MTFQLIGIAMITAISALLLKDSRPELSFCISVAGGIILLLFAFEMFREGMSVFEKIASATGIKSDLFKTLLKMLGIGYLVEFSAGMIRDFGQNSVADKLIFAGKITLLLLSVPILESVLDLIYRLIGLMS